MSGSCVQLNVLIPWLLICVCVRERVWLSSHDFKLQIQTCCRALTDEKLMSPHNLSVHRTPLSYAISLDSAPSAYFCFILLYVQIYLVIPHSVCLHKWAALSLLIHRRLGACQRGDHHEFKFSRMKKCNSCTLAILLIIFCALILLVEGNPVTNCYNFTEWEKVNIRERL